MNEVNNPEVVAILGASGFIGRHTVSFLAAHGIPVIAVARSGIPSSTGKSVIWKCVPDFNDPTELSEAISGATCVIHLADDPVRSARAAVDEPDRAARLAGSVVRAAKEAGVRRCILASSIYARLAQEGKITDYGKSKLQTEAVFLQGEDRPQTLVLRLPPVYGEGGRGGMATLISLVTKGLPLPLSAALPERSYLSIDNLTALILALIRADEESWQRADGRFYEPSDGAPVNARDLAQAIGHTITRPARFVSVPPFMLRLAGKLLGKDAMVSGIVDACTTRQVPSLAEDFGWQAHVGLPQSLSWLQRLPAGQARPGEEQDGTKEADAPTPARQQGQAVKRVFDLAAASIGLVMLSPLILLLIVLIRLETPGPGIFAQRRVGRGNVPFTCYKMRTMVTETREALTHESARSSVTRLGRFLRATKLDELPQLWNIVRGEMSFVGPRPGLLIDERLIEERGRRNVLSLRPGITGIAQVAGIDMSDPVRLAETDAQYLSRQSLWLDLKLILMTVTGAGSGDRVG